jgi:hypothetical protein
MDENSESEFFFSSSGIVFSLSEKIKCLSKMQGDNTANIEEKQKTTIQHLKIQ